MSGYSKGLACPICDKPITNAAHMCYKHSLAFLSWLYQIYGCRPRLGKRTPTMSKSEATRQAILDALADSPMSTPELARAIGKTAGGARYACRILAERGRIEMLENGYRTVWALADNQGCDNAPGRN